VINKKGISPLIATVLLIGFTIVLAALVIRWGSELFSSQIKTQTCDNEATIECTSDVNIGISTAIYDAVPSGGRTEELTIALLSNGKKTIDKGFIVRIHQKNGEVRALSSTDTLTAFGTQTLNVNTAALSPTFDITQIQTCGTAYCGVSIIPKISHTTNKGDTCEVTCGQSEKRSTFNLVETS